MIWKASLVLCLALCVIGGRRPAISEQKVKLFYTSHHGDLKHIGHHEPEHHEVYAWAYPSYEFSYTVDDPHTHDKKGQHEIRDGDKVTGDYWLIQPDGHKRVVKYQSDHKNGFQAEVKYIPLDHHEEVREHNDEVEHKKKEEHIEDYSYGWIREDLDKKPVIEHHDDHGHKVGHGWERENRDEKHDMKHDDRSHKNGPQWHYERNEGKNEKHHDEKQEIEVEKKDSHDIKRGGDDRWGDRIPKGHRLEEEKREGKKDVHESHDIHHDYEGHLWGIRGWGIERKDHKDERHEEPGNVGWKHGPDHREHWKHGVLVGWTEGRGFDDHRKGDDRQIHENHHGNGGRRGNFKPLIPYGHRLD